MVVSFGQRQAWHDPRKWFVACTVFALPYLAYESCDEYSRLMPCMERVDTTINETIAVTGAALSVPIFIIQQRVIRGRAR